MCICVGIGTRKSLKFTVVFVFFTTFMLSTSAKVLQSLSYAEFKSKQVPHTYSVSQSLPSPVYLYGICGRIKTQKLHKHMKCHLKAPNLMSVTSYEYVVDGNASGTTYLTSAPSNRVWNITMHVAMWSLKSYLWAPCWKTSRKSTKSHERGVVWMCGCRQFVRHDVLD